jgi:glycosyltransferase involved in cell wall biosynthesis
MLIFQLWSFGAGFVFFVLGIRTKRFTKNLLSLDSLPEEFKLSPLEKKFSGGQIWPKISLVIPACNEGETIQAAMNSLLKVDYPNLEVIVVNDRSDDKTRQIVDQFSMIDDRIIPVHVNYLPPGWLGKVNALRRGIDESTAEWILLSDADVHFTPDSFKNAMTYCLKGRFDFLTAIPDVITKGNVLHVVITQLFHQASLFFRSDKLNEPSHPACYGQGAFMLMRKATYLKSQRLEWLKMEVVDDTGLALLMRRAGARMAAVAGLNQIQLEWYPSFRSFLRGIEKNAFAFSQYSVTILIAFHFAVYALNLGIVVAPFFAGSAFFKIFTFGCYAFYLSTVQQQMKRILNLKPWTIFAIPVAAMVLPLLFVRASLLTLLRGGVNWRGTFYSLADLKANQRMKLANLVFVSPELTLPAFLPEANKEQSEENRAA